MKRSCRAQECDSAYTPSEYVMRVLRCMLCYFNIIYPHVYVIRVFFRVRGMTHSHRIATQHNTPNEYVMRVCDATHGNVTKHSTLYECVMSMSHATNASCKHVMSHVTYTNDTSHTRMSLVTYMNEP